MLEGRNDPRMVLGIDTDPRGEDDSFRPAKNSVGLRYGGHLGQAVVVKRSLVTWVCDAAVLRVAWRK